MHRALYRKWRPGTFDEVCGQGQITDILKYQVANGKTSHAYLFCGSRGTGKTTCAKILAKAVNCLSPVNGNPCCKCAACLSVEAGVATDVIEMDAASNNGVDDVRDLKDEIVYTPAELKYRVYIIDEVHMMSGSAFNALLKTLEEPPSHVLFVLATTELQKLPVTIVSRCQRYDFRRIGVQVIAERLKTIAAAEGIALEDSGATLIARLSAGGMRDAISTLELCAGSHVKIDEEAVISLVGAGGRKEVEAVVRAILSRDYAKMYATVADLISASVDLSVFWQDLMNYYRDMLVLKTVADAAEYLDLTPDEALRIKEVAESFNVATLLWHSKMMEDAFGFIQRNATLKRSCVEMTLVRMCEPRLSVTTDSLLSRITALEDELALLKLNGIAVPSTDAKAKAPRAERKAGDDGDAEAAPKEEPPMKEKETAAVKVASEASQPTEAAKEKPIVAWRSVIDKVRESKPTIAGFLKETAAYLMADGSCVVKIGNAFGATRLKQRESLDCLRVALSTVAGVHISEGMLKIEQCDARSLNEAKAELERLLGEENAINE